MHELLLYAVFILSINTGLLIYGITYIKDFFYFLTSKLVLLMATIEQFQAAIDKIKAGVDELKAQLTNAGLSADVEASVLSQLEAIATAFDAPAPDGEVAPVE
jgi:hypothetical protein